MIAARRALALPHRAATRRMLFALGASLLVHFLIAGDWPGMPDPVRPATDLPPLQARLEPVIPPAVMAPQPDVPPVSTPPARPAVPDTVPDGADSRFYLARELDQYPLPLSVLENDRGSVRLWVGINQAGRVVDAAVIDLEPSGEFAQSLRERVLATRFVPARRDGRPVKSRVLLVLGQGG